jgi:hypothetical protein
LIPEQDQNDEICLIAVNKNGLLLNHIFESKRTQLVCFTAVNQNGESIQYVPEQFLSEELYCTAVKQNAFSIQFVPKDLQIEELCIIAVNKEGLSLYYIHESKRTQLVCFTAVNQNGESLQYVPEEFLSEEFYLNAINKNNKILRYIKLPNRTNKMYYCALQHNDNDNDNRYIFDDPVTFSSLNLKKIYKDVFTEFPFKSWTNKTLRDCRYAIEYDPWNIEYIPENLRQKDFYDDAYFIMNERYILIEDSTVLQDFIKIIPKEFQTAHMCRYILAEMKKRKSKDIPDFLSDRCKKSIEENQKSSCCIF